MTKHQNALARTYCDGFAPWAKCLCHLGLVSVAREPRDGVVFSPSYYPAGTMMIFTECCAESLITTVFFRLKPKLLAPDILAEVEAAALIADWRDVCAAYVRFEVDLTEARPLRCLDHNAIEKAAHDLLVPAVLEDHEASFVDLMARMSTVLARYREDNGIEDVSDRYSDLLAHRNYHQR